MEAKKNPKKDVNRSTGMFFNVGLAVSIAAVIFFFELKFYDDLETIDLGTLDADETELIDIPITEIPPPPPPVLQQPEIVEIPDEEEIEEQVEMELDVEVEEETVPDVPVKIDAPPPPPPVEEAEPDFFEVVESMPEPQGGRKAFYQFIGNKLKYPKQARRMGVEGMVVVQMIVDKDGSLTDFKVVKGIGAGCDEEALRVLKLAPKW
ncbi:MAG: energy transducer TonB, partial [Bacteroidota bacterium]